MQNKFNITVGIVTAKSLSFVLHGNYECNGVTISGHHMVEQSEDGIRFGDKNYKQLCLKALGNDCSFELHDVMIGVDFHWQRRETQRFEGDLQLINTPQGVLAINVIDIERYLFSVISSEMNGDAPKELLKSHAVISRSWLVAQIRNRFREHGHKMTFNDDEIIAWNDRDDHDLFDVCADDHCQRYQGITRAGNPNVAAAIDATRGMVLYDNEGNVADTRFSKCCGGVTELFENCWQPEHHHYLVALRDSNDGEPLPDLTDEAEASKWINSSPDTFCNTTDARVLSTILNKYDCETPDFYRWEVEYTQAELSSLLQRKANIDFGRIKALRAIRRGPSGRITSLEIVGEKRSIIVGKELYIRRWLSESHLYSSAFTIATTGSDADGYPLSFTLHGAGWGHGVGLCQIGAAVMATKGYNHREILDHYFPGATLAQLKIDK